MRTATQLHTYVRLFSQVCKYMCISCENVMNELNIVEIVLATQSFIPKIITEVQGFQSQGLSQSC